MKSQTNVLSAIIGHFVANRDPLKSTEGHIEYSLRHQGRENWVLIRHEPKAESASLQEWIEIVDTDSHLMIWKLTRFEDAPTGVTHHTRRQRMGIQSQFLTDLNTFVGTNLNWDPDKTAIFEELQD